MSNNVKIIFTKSNTLRGSINKIKIAEELINTVKVENSEYFKKVTEALKQVPYEEIKTKSMSY